MFKGELTQVRQQSLGIKHYIWHSEDEDMICEDHISNNGKVFSWNTTPSIGHHPGQTYHCRCLAEPLIEDKK
jgi:SPP1 gp7 family putative phage head morphogenesis protein